MEVTRCASLEGVIGMEIGCLISAVEVEGSAGMVSLSEPVRHCLRVLRRSIALVRWSLGLYCA